MRKLAAFLSLCMSATAQDFRLAEVARGFAAPVDIQFPRDRSGRMFVVEQAGRIRLVKQGVLQATPFLDIRSRVASGGERGLLSMALAPNFRANGRFYVHYSDLRGDTVIARFTVSSANPDQADPASEQIVLQAQQPASNHNGGTIVFGPDGYLYIGLGDGGRSNDQFQNGQNRTSLLGKLLRIDVEGGASTYSIPTPNPFVNDSSYRPEIWALGLRNPWRFSFDRDTGDLWIGDVGQNRAEEVDFQPAASKGGENYGWPVMEGLRCRTGVTCANQGMTPPVHEYTREKGDASMVGGYVYRGLAMGASGANLYFFADYVSGRIWALPPASSGQGRIDVRGPGFNVSAFGEDANGELYVAEYAGGIHRLERTGANPLPMNAASFQPGISPGMLATIFWEGLRSDDPVALAQATPLPRTLAGIEVLVDGENAPLLAVARNQVNFQIPYGARNGFGINVLRDGLFLTGIIGVGSISADGRLPGIFSYSGSREAIIVRNSDFSLVDVLEPDVDYFFYATGLGPVTSPVEAGNAAKADPLSRMPVPPTVVINGVDCPVIFAGLAPGFVGVFQINFRLGSNVPGGTHQMVLATGGSASNGNWVNVR